MSNIYNLLTEYDDASRKLEDLVAVGIHLEAFGYTAELKAMHSETTKELENYNGVITNEGILEKIRLVFGKISQVFQKFADSQHSIIDGLLKNALDYFTGHRKYLKEADSLISGYSASVKKHSALIATLKKECTAMDKGKDITKHIKKNTPVKGDEAKHIKAAVLATPGIWSKVAPSWFYPLDVRAIPHGSISKEIANNRTILQTQLDLYSKANTEVVKAEKAIDKLTKDDDKESVTTLIDPPYDAIMAIGLFSKTSSYVKGNMPSSIFEIGTGDRILPMFMSASSNIAITMPRATSADAAAALTGTKQTHDLVDAYDEFFKLAQKMKKSHNSMWDDYFGLGHAIADVEVGFFNETFFNKRFERPIQRAMINSMHVRAMSIELMLTAANHQIAIYKTLFG